MRTDLHLWRLYEYFLEWEMFWAKVVEKIKIHIFNNFFFRNSFPFTRKCVKNGADGQATHIIEGKI